MRSRVRIAELTSLVYSDRNGRERGAGLSVQNRFACTVQGYGRFLLIKRQLHLNIKLYAIGPKPREWNARSHGLTLMHNKSMDILAIMRLNWNGAHPASWIPTAKIAFRTCIFSFSNMLPSQTESSNSITNGNRQNVGEKHDDDD